MERNVDHRAFGWASAAAFGVNMPKFENDQVRYEIDRLFSR
jgi:hypothetical protein